MDSNNNNNSNINHEDVDEIPLPGFRFHPTDDELVGFYLRRKVEKKPISIELIKAIDIYKYDPWDLPKATTDSEDKEWYFFCKRGRKYKNSVRPNRVTGSGFWKATGIDKPVHSHGEEGGHRCIGLKKTLVYYRGSAGKGTKTDWMMHEFRLPSNLLDAKTNRSNAKTDLQEAEIWTLCRIFKRNMCKKYTPDWRELSAKRQPMDTLKKSNINNDHDHQYSSSNINNGESYIDFTTPIIYHEEKKPVIANHHHHDFEQVLSSSMAAATQYHQYPSSMNSLSSFSSYQDIENIYHDLFTYADWDELRSVVDDQFAVGPTLL